jgi:hypothetical protein
MKWSVVPAMHLKPYRCIACGSTPRDTSHPKRPQLQAYFAEGIDVNYGDSVFLCEECVKVLGQLRGMDVHEKTVKDRDQWKKSYHEAMTELEETNDRVERMLDGVRAKKEATGARKKRVSANA